RHTRWPRDWSSDVCSSDLEDSRVQPRWPLLAVSNARPSRLNARIFASLGELRNTYVILFVLVVIIFLLIEAVAWTTGIVLTRRRSEERRVGKEGTDRGELE